MIFNLASNNCILINKAVGLLLCFCRLVNLAKTNMKVRLVTLFSFNYHRLCGVAWWCDWYGGGRVIEGSQVRLAAVSLLGNDSRQVVHTRLPLSPRSIIWYQIPRT